MLFLPREKGQGLVEYALILVLVAIVVIAILLLLGPLWTCKLISSDFLHLELCKNPGVILLQALCGVKVA